MTNKININKSKRFSNFIANFIIVYLLFTLSILLSSCEQVGFDLDTKSISPNGKIRIEIKNQNVKGRIIKAEMFSGNENIAFYNPAFKNSGTYDNSSMTLQPIKEIEEKIYSSLVLKVTFQNDNGKTTNESTSSTPEGFKTFKFNSLLSIKSGSSNSKINKINNALDTTDTAVFYIDLKD